MATIFRGPIVQRIARVTTLAAILAGPVPNLLATTLKPAATPAPFSQDDWPNPRIAARAVDNLTSIAYFVLDDNDVIRPIDWPNPRPARRIDALTWTQSLTTTTLNGPVVPPRRPIDWPNHQQKLRSVDLLTHADPSEFWILKDKFFGAPGQPPTWDWPNPRIAKRIDYTWTQNTPQSFAAVQNPFGQDDWPNPGIPRRTDALTWLLNSLQSFAPIQAPFGQDDWPNPGIARRIDALTWIQLPQLVPAATAPFTQSDWPNPGIKAWAIENRTESDPSEFWLLKDQFFGAPGQPPSPTPAAPYRAAIWPIDGRTWLQNHLQDTLAPAAALPFSLDDWPVPAGYRYPISLRTLAEFTRLLGKDRIFGGAGQPISNFQQPNPLGYIYPIDLRTEFARQTLTTAIPALDAACIIQIGSESWVILVPAEPRILDAEDD